MRLLTLVWIFAATAYPQLSADKELAMGTRMAADLEANHARLHDPAVIGFVDEVVQRVVRGQTLRTPLQLMVFQTPDRVMSALPGGFLVISSGTILASESEAQFAGMVAHAVAHAQAEVVVRKVPGGLPMVFTGGPWGACTKSFPGSGTLLAPESLTNLKAREQAADTLAPVFLATAGYDLQPADSPRFEEIKAKLASSLTPVRPVPTLRR